MLQAAILHDVLEDTDCSFQELQLAFGSEVADVVMVRSTPSSLPGALPLDLEDAVDLVRSPIAQAHHLLL